MVVFDIQSLEGNCWSMEFQEERRITVIVSATIWEVTESGNDCHQVTVSLPQHPMVTVNWFPFQSLKVWYQKGPNLRRVVST